MQVMDQGLTTRDGSDPTHFDATIGSSQERPGGESAIDGSLYESTEMGEGTPSSSHRGGEQSSRPPALGLDSVSPADPSQAAPGAPGKSRKPRVKGLPPTRVSKRARGQDPDEPPGGSTSAGIYMVIDPSDMDLIRNPLHDLLVHPEPNATIHAVIAAAMGSKSPKNPKRNTHRDALQKEPKQWKDLHNHQMGQQFRDAAHKEINTLLKAGTWEEIDRPNTGERPLPLKWVFTYKLDQDGYLIKCKARIVVRGDLQLTDSIHSTYAATLAARTFRTAIAIGAKFDLEIYQYDVVGAFLNASRDQHPTVICELPEGYRIPGKCVKLKRALYGLKDSPLLWYNELSTTLRENELIASKEEPCLFFNRDRSILLIFYVDDILSLYHRNYASQAHRVIQALKQRYNIEEKGPVSWFLGVRVIRDRKRRTITLVHDEYIDKIAKKFDLAETGKFPATPLSSEDIKKSTGEATKKEIKDYQERVGSILYTSIMVRPDIAYAASRLSQYLTNPSKQHFDAVNRVIVYLYRTRYQSIQYGNGDPNELMICSDASFADDIDTRRSSHGYLITLFGGPIIWKAARQATVTTSTTEAELLALEQVSKEAMALKRFLTEIHLTLDTTWTINCDNQQTIRLVVGNNERITTKLRHVDIQNMWLRQEHAKGSFHIAYLPTSDMPADGLTKNLTAQQFIRFREHLKLHDSRAQIT